MLTPTAMGYNDHQYQNNETNAIKNSLSSHNLSPTLSPTTIAIATMAPSTEAPLPLSPSSPRPHNQQLPSSRFLSSFSLFSIHSLCLYLIFFLLREARYGKKIFLEFIQIAFTFLFFFCEKPNTGKYLSIHSNCLYRFLSLESFPSLLRSQIWKNNSLVIHSAFIVHLLSFAYLFIYFEGIYGKNTLL